MKTNLTDITDGVATFNADPFCISDYLDEVRGIIKAADEILEHTPGNTDEEDWERMCALLDLDSGSAGSIYEVRNNGAYTMLFAAL